MLLVDYGQSEGLEDHIVLDQRMCSYYDPNASVFQPGMYLATLGSLGASCQKS